MSERALPVVLATGNRGKAREFGRLLDGALEVRSMPDGVVLPEETGMTFSANARLKAQAVFAALGGVVAVLADDSGLEVEALEGRPGVLSARYAGEAARDEDNVGKLLRDLGGTEDRRARFVCSLCLALPTEAGSGFEGGARGEITAPVPRLVEVEGYSQGLITRAARGEDGFGYDPIFQPDGWDVTLAEAAPAAKDGVSHRGAAARALLQHLDCESRTPRGS